VLNDLKALDKLAKATEMHTVSPVAACSSLPQPFNISCPLRISQAAKKDDVPEASAKLRDDLLAFVALTPQKLTDKFGVSDL